MDFMIRFSHLTPSYILNRIGIEFWERKRPDAPWLTRASVEFLEDWLQPGDHGLEFGSGRSTLWFAERVAHLISVENDRRWYEDVAGKITRFGLNDKIDYRFCNLDTRITDPEASDYVLVTQTIKDNSLDFCLVDGSARGYCATAVINKIKPSGIIIIDDIDTHIPSPDSRLNRSPHTPNSRDKSIEEITPKWNEFLCCVEGWRYIWTSNVKKDTAIWFKPV